MYTVLYMCGCGHCSPVYLSMCLPMLPAITYLHLFSKPFLFLFPPGLFIPHQLCYFTLACSFLINSTISPWPVHSSSTLLFHPGLFIPHQLCYFTPYIRHKLLMIISALLWSTVSPPLEAGAWALTDSACSSQTLPISRYICVHVLMRDETEGREKRARSNEQASSVAQW